MFDIFIQDGQALDGRRGGLGLGLAIVRNLVQLHGGSVTARSEGEGRGAEFVVRIPVSNAASPYRPEAPAARVDSEVRRRVLIVDDNQDAAEFLAIGLTEMGHETHGVDDGSAALSAAEAFDPDVVLLDLGLPNMDGYQIAEHLRERFGRSRPRLVAVTGYGQESDRVRTRQGGFDEHLIKPVAFERLHEAVVRSVTR